MKWVKHDLADFAFTTQRLSPLEAGMLVRLRDWQLGHEAALPLDEADLMRIAGAHERYEATALQRVLELHLVRTELGWVHPASWAHMVELGCFDGHPVLAQAMVSRGHEGVTRDPCVTPVTPLPSQGNDAVSRTVSRGVTSQRMRQRELRERKARLYDALAEKGVYPRAKAPVSELTSLCREAGIEVIAAPRRHAGVTRSVTPHARPLNSIPGQEQPDGGEGARRAESARDTGVTPSAFNGTAAGAAGRALREGGINPLEINTAHPKLLALLEAGCSLDELRGAAVSAVSKGKGFAYALAMLEGQRREQSPIAPRLDLTAWIGKAS